MEQTPDSGHNRDVEHSDLHHRNTQSEEQHQYGNSHLQQTVLAAAGPMEHGTDSVLHDAISQAPLDEDLGLEDEVTTVREDESARLLEALAGATGRRSRRTAALEMVEWCRDHLVDEDLLEAYLAQSQVSIDDKTALIGQMAVEIARNEFLLGRAYQGGSRRGWNAEHFTNYYRDTIHNQNERWCTTFAGHTLMRLGLETGSGDRFLQGPRDSTRHSMFNSGYRLGRWADEGLNNSYTPLTPQGMQPAVMEDAGMGSAFLDQGDFRELRSRVDGIASPAERLAAVEGFFESHPRPQSGDLIVTVDNRDGEHHEWDGRSHSHTRMVEQMTDAFVIHTVEGNGGGTGTGAGYDLDLTDANDVGKFVYMVRVGAEYFMESEDLDRSMAGVEGSWTGLIDEQRVVPEALLEPMRALNARVARVAQDAGWVGGTGPEALVSQMY